MGFRKREVSGREEGACCPREGGALLPPQGLDYRCPRCGFLGWIVQEELVRERVFFFDPRRGAMVVRSPKEGVDRYSMVCLRCGYSIDLYSESQEERDALSRVFYTLCFGGGSAGWMEARGEQDERGRGDSFWSGRRSLLWRRGRG